MKSASLLKEETGDGQAQVYRYIRLTEFIPELLDLVDEGRIAFRPVVELSYLQKEKQSALLQQISIARGPHSLVQRDDVDAPQLALGLDAPRVA